MYQQAVAVLFVLFCWPVISQECSLTIKGTVSDFHDGAPLELATIYIQELERSVTTNSDGSFRINNLCPGTYSVYVSHIECDPKLLEIKLNKSITKNILLEHHTLDEVNVLADVHDNHSTTEVSTRIDQPIIERYSAATLGDALASVAGVTTLKTGNSIVKPIVQGLYGSRVAIVNNGIRQQDQEWGVEHAPNIDLNTASSIRVVKGGAALRYGGDAIGGVIVIEPARIIKKDTLKGRVITQGQTNGRGGSATASFENYRESGWYQQATLTYKKLGDYDAPEYVLSNTGSETMGLNASGGYKQFEYGGSVNYSFYDTEIGILRAAHLGNVGDLVASINSRSPRIIRDFSYDIENPRQDVQHHTVKLDGFYRLPSLGKLSAEYSFQFNNRLEYGVRRERFDGKPAMDMDLTTHFLAARMEFDASDDFVYEVGVDGFYQINVPSAETDVRRLIPDYVASKIGGYANATYTTDSWVLDAGARYDFYSVDAQKYYRESRWEDLNYDVLYPQFERFVDGTQIYTEPSFDFDLVSATVGAKHYFNDHFDTGLNISLNSRAPNPSELFSEGLHHSLARIELGMLDAKKEVSFKTQALFHANSKGWDVYLNPYFNLVDDYLQIIPMGEETTTRGAFPVWEYEQIDARLFGVDLTASYTFSPSAADDRVDLFEIGTRIAYVNGEDVDKNVPLINMPPLQFTNQISWANALGTNLNFSISNDVVMEQQRFPDNDFVTTIINENNEREEVLVTISQPPPAFSLWGAGIEYAFPMGSLCRACRGTKAKIRLTASNIFNTRYRNYLNALRFFADEVGRDVQLQFIYKF